MTASDAASIIIFKQMFVYDTESRKGNGTMSENELELIKIIRESEDPEKAMITAIKIIRDYINVELV